MRNATLPRLFAAIAATIVTLVLFDTVARMGEYADSDVVAASATAPLRAAAA